MLLKPPLPLVIFFLFGTVLSLYNLYGYWFNVDHHHKRSIKRIDKLHPQYPFKEYATKLVRNKRAWTAQGRALSTFNSIVIFIASCVLIYAYFFGK